MNMHKVDQIETPVGLTIRLPAARRLSNSEVYRLSRGFPRLPSCARSDRMLQLSRRHTGRT